MHNMGTKLTKCVPDGFLNFSQMINNARPHSVNATQECIEKLKLEQLILPAHSPDLAPSDFHMFGPMKEALRGQQFDDDDEVKEMVHSWLRSQPKKMILRA